MRTINKVIYLIFGGLALLYGVAGVLSPKTVAGEAASAFFTGHIVREQAAAGVFLGLMTLWCAFNYEQRIVVHYFLMVFAFLLAAIHWFDYLAGHIGWLSPIYNSVPFMVLLIMEILRRAGRNPEKITEAQKVPL
jgi:hypothetical protein